MDFEVNALACDVQQKGQTPKTMLDQKQNWLVSGAYPSHIFRLERHRNHHVEILTHSHINTKSRHCHTQKRKSKHNRRTTFHNHLRGCRSQCTACGGWGTNMDSNLGQCSIRSRTGLYLVLICHISSDWSGTESSHRDSYTSTHTHTNTPTHSEQKMR